MKRINRKEVGRYMSVLMFVAQTQTCSPNPIGQLGVVLTQHHWADVFVEEVNGQGGRTLLSKRPCARDQGESQCGITISAPTAGHRDVGDKYATGVPNIKKIRGWEHTFF